MQKALIILSFIVGMFSICSQSYQPIIYGPKPYDLGAEVGKAISETVNAQIQQNMRIQESMIISQFQSDLRIREQEAMMNLEQQRQREERRLEQERENECLQQRKIEFERQWQIEQSETAERIRNYQKEVAQKIGSAKGQNELKVADKDAKE